jgi:hypothetical protein
MDTTELKAPVNHYGNRSEHSENNPLNEDQSMNAVMNLETTSNSLQQFYQQLLKSPELQAKLKTANSPESLCQMAVQLGEEMGYNFTIEQARAALAIEVAMGGDAIEESNLSTGISPVARFTCNTCRK